jgi:hypothetical protein
LTRFLSPSWTLWPIGIGIAVESQSPDSGSRGLAIDSNIDADCDPDSDPDSGGGLDETAMRGDHSHGVGAQSQFALAFPLPAVVDSVH